MTASEPTTLSRLETCLNAIVAHLASIDQKLSQGSLSSVELKTSTRGTDVAVKHYSDDALDQIGTVALDEYRRLTHELTGA